MRIRWAVDCYEVLEWALDIVGLLAIFAAAIGVYFVLSLQQ